MTQDARPSGASIRQRVFGEIVIEQVWGGVWNCPGL